MEKEKQKNQINPKFLIFTILPQLCLDLVP